MNEVSRDGCVTYTDQWLDSTRGVDTCRAAADKQRSPNLTPHLTESCIFFACCSECSVHGQAMSTAGALATGVLRGHIEAITHHAKSIMGCFASCCRKQGTNAIQAVRVCSSNQHSAPTLSSLHLLCTCMLLSSYQNFEEISMNAYVSILLRLSVLCVV